jgi:uncharacterized protein YpmB
VNPTVCCPSHHHSSIIIITITIIIIIIIIASAIAFPFQEARSTTAKRQMSRIRYLDKSLNHEFWLRHQ